MNSIAQTKNDQSTYLHVLTKCYIIIVGNTVHYPPFLRNIIFLIHSIQTLPLLILGCPTNSEYQITYIGYISPCQCKLLSQNTWQYVVIGVLVILMALIGYICIYSYNMKNLLCANYQGDTLTVIMNKATTMQSIILAVISTVWQLIGQVLYLPILYISITTLQYSLELSQYLIAIIAILLILISSIIVIFNTILVDETPFYEPYGFNRLNQTQVSIFTIVLNITQLFCYAILVNSISEAYIQVILQLLVSMLTLYDIYFNYTFGDEQQIYIAIISQSFAIVFTMSQLIFNRILNDPKNSVVTIILLFPLLTYILLKQWQQTYHDSIFIETIDCKVLQFRLAILLKDNKQSFWIIRALLFGQHRKQCDKPSCQCKVIEIFDIFNPVHNKFFNYIKRHQCVKLGRALNVKNNNKLNNNIYLFHYIAALNTLGFVTQAFQQVSSCNGNSKVRIQALPALDGSLLNTHSTTTQKQLENVKMRFLSNRHSFAESSSSHMVLEPLPEQNERLLNPMGFIDHCKLDILQLDIRKNIQFSLGIVNIDQQNNQKYVQVYLKSEREHIQIIGQIVSLLICRQQFLIDYVKPNILNGDNYMKSIISLSNQMRILNNKLSKQYDEFPTERLQIILSFLQGEIMNDYLLAYRTSKITNQSNEGMSKILSVFQHNVTYLIFAYESNNQLAIRNSSPQSHRLFGYSYEEFNKIQDIDTLLPPTIRKLHKHFVGAFIQSGQSKYFNKQNQSFLYNSANYVQSIDLFYDINYSDMSNFSFVTFMQPQPTDAAYIFVSPEGTIGGITRNLLNKLRIPHKSVSESELANAIYRLTIDVIFPQFMDVVNTPLEVQNTDDMYNLRDQCIIHQDSMEMRFLLASHFETAGRQQQDTRQDTYALWFKPQNLQLYKANVKIHSKLLKNLQYYIIQVLQIKQSNTESQQKSLNITQISEILDIQINEDEEENPNMPQVMYVSDFAPYRQGEDRVARGSGQVAFKHNHKGDEEQNPNVRIYGPEDDQQLFSLVSPVHSQKRLFSQTFQQQFYKDHEEIEINNNNSIQEEGDAAISSKANNFTNDMAKRQHSMDQIQAKSIFMSFNKNYEDQQEVLDEINEQQSQIQSITAFKASKYFNKYTFYHKLLSNDLVTKQFSASLGFLITFMAINIILTSIILTYTVSDFDRMQHELQLLKLRKLITGPQTKSIATQLTLQNYKELEKLEIISHDQYETLITYTMARVFQNYQDMKLNFASAFENPYLTDFFVDEYSDVYITDTVDVEHIQTNKTLRSQLNMLMTSQQAVAMQILNDVDNIGTNLQYYAISNFYSIFYQLEEVSHKLLEYMQTRIIDIINNWNSLSLYFIISAVIMALLSLYYELEQAAFYQRLLQQIDYISVDYQQKESDRIQLLLSLLESDRNIILTYRFDLPDKDEYLKHLEKKQIGKSSAKSVRQPIVLVQMRIRAYISYLILVGLFIGYSVWQLRSTTDFLEGFKSTSQYLFETSEMVSIINSAEVVTELAYNSHEGEYAFLGKESIEQYIGLVELCVEHIEEFLGWAYFVNNISLLGGDMFVQQFAYYSGHDICGIFDEQYLMTATLPCQESLESNLKLGFIPTLLFVNTQLRNELEIGFENRDHINYPLNQIEGVLVTADCIDIVSQYLFDGFNELTDQLQVVKIAVSIGYVVYLAISCYLIFVCLIPFQRRRCHNVLSTLSLLPIYSIILENQYERSMRLLAIRQEWI